LSRALDVVSHHHPLPRAASPAHGALPMKFQRAVAIGAAVAVQLCDASLAAAQEVPDMPDISSLAGVVRWTGIFFSILIVVGASLLLRFVQSAAESLATQFTTRRLLIQKIESFTRFFVYFATG